MKTVYALLAVLPFLAATAAEKPALAGAEPGVWTMDYDAACRVAAEKKLPLLLNFTGSDWCGWCKLMDKQVFAQDAWKTYASANLMLVWLDFPNDKSLVPEKFVARNQALAKRFEVGGYPTYIVLDDDGKTQLGQLGADRDSSPERFVSQVKGVLQNRAAAVEALLKTLPEAAANDYRETQKRLERARAELKDAEAAFEKRSAELTATVEQSEKRLADLRTGARLARLPKEKAEAYTAKSKRLDAANAELKAWIETKPARNEQNSAKYKAWADEISTLEKEMQALLE